MIHYYDIMYNSVTMWWAKWWDINMISLGTNFNPVNMHLSSLIVTNHIYKQLFSRNCSLELRDRQVFSKFYKFLFETARLDYLSFYISGPDIFYIQIWRQKKKPFFLRNIWIRVYRVLNGRTLFRLELPIPYNGRTNRGVLQTNTSETYFNFKLTLVNSHHLREC